MSSMNVTSSQSLRSKDPIRQTNPNYKTLVGTRVYYERVPLKKEQLPKVPAGFTVEFGSDFVTKEPFAYIKGRFKSSQAHQARMDLLLWVQENFTKRGVGR